MNGLLEKLRRGAIRALGGYVELVPPPKPQDRALIKEERYRVRKIEVRAMPFDNRPRAEELLQRYKKYSSERCKLGGEVWAPGCGRSAKLRVVEAALLLQGEDGEGYEKLSDFGKTFFATKEGAEEAKRNEWFT